ncbi:MAG: hypothetical protein GVY20_13905 [Bacteroidetes bacterium]|jgi:hypothetical protein|nr:hypothetical protein [Bacteroidota bacterium]
MDLDHRLSKLEAVNNPEQLPDIEIVIVDCVTQAKHPERFNQVPAEYAHGIDKQVYRLEPKDPDFTCNCHCCQNH